MAKQIMDIERLEVLFEDGMEDSHGFFDWFCTDKGLAGRASRIAPKIVKVLKANETGKWFDESKIKLLLKNNCPMDGQLYDDFRVCDKESGDVIFTVIPSSGHNHISGNCILWGSLNDFSEEIMNTSNFQEIVDFFSGKNL